MFLQFLYEIRFGLNPEHELHKHFTQRQRTGSRNMQGEEFVGNENTCIYNASYRVAKKTHTRNGILRTMWMQ